MHSDNEQNSKSIIFNHYDISQKLFCVERDKIIAVHASIKDSDKLRPKNVGEIDLRHPKEKEIRVRLPNTASLKFNKKLKSYGEISFLLSIHY